VEEAAESIKKEIEIDRIKSVGSPDQHQREGSMVLTIRDENATGSVTNELTLDVLSETITVRELVRSRIYQEVDEHNRRVRQAVAGVTPYNGLVTPTPDERTLNGTRDHQAVSREIDWRKQFAAACQSFERNGFFILVGERQAESLDEVITLKHDTRVSFVKLTQLVGG
jgi:hypothetical protein